ncbi:reverse transcriptase domain-containing protein [Citrus sinensis]|nr:reverse transcriptase domain-containing protein [Citrus sinensis]
MESVSELAKKDPPPLEGDRSAKKAKFRIEGDDEDNPPLLVKPWRTAVVIKLLGRTIGYKSGSQGFTVIDLENDFSWLSLKRRVMPNNALTQGPWSILGHYLTVQQWSPRFDCSTETIDSGVAWIRLPGMPHHYYHKRILRMLGQVIGKVIKIDYNTESPCRGKFARIAVELDLAKPLCSQFLLDGKLQKVEYENLPLICYECGKYSHLSITCLERTSNEEDTHGAELSLRSVLGRLHHPRQIDPEDMMERGTKSTEETHVLDLAIKGPASKIQQHAKPKLSKSFITEPSTSNSMHTYRPLREYKVAMAKPFNTTNASTTLDPTKHSVVTLEKIPSSSTQNVFATTPNLLFLGEDGIYEKLDDNLTDDPEDSDYVGDSGDEESVDSKSAGSLEDEPQLALEHQDFVPDGVSSKGFRRTFKGFVKNYTPTMVAILEPTDSGFFGEEEFAVEVTVNHRQFIHFRVSDNGGIISSITAVYASLIPSMRKHLWSELDKLASFVQEPWILGGDFNVILNASEKRGGSRRTNSVCQLFNGWFQRNQLCDLEFKGPSFTWTRGSVYKRLDRAICNDKWVENFPNASMLHLPKVCSDHRPILVRFEKIQSACSSPKPFRFLASSLTDKRFESLVSSIWQPDMNYLQSAKHFVEEASLWNSNVFGNIFKRKNRLLVRIGGIQQALETHHSNNLIRLECQLKKELEEVLTQEELLRYQKSRREWIQCGDRNTSFFHRKTIQRRRRNRIEMIKDDMGNWLLDNNAIKEYVVSYFSKLYTKEDEFYKPYPIRNAFPVFERSQLQGFSLAVDDEEIKNVVFCMKALKAKGIDSLHALFYQTQWNVVGNSVCKLIKDIFSGTEVPKELNRTLLVLIPKSDNPTSLKLFRPISLCPVIYKTIIKLLANRLKAIMPELIGPNQTSFVPRRHITENIVIAQEVIHSIR